MGTNANINDTSKKGDILTLVKHDILSTYSVSSSNEMLWEILAHINFFNIPHRFMRIGNFFGTKPSIISH